MKDTDYDRIQELRHFAANDQIKKLAQWIWDLMGNGEYKKPARVLKAAEKMQKLARKSEK
ncbi:MAG: hypothetical protein RBT15_04670 [Gudongella sp.]|jgi:hypothetical protein|nr:hypothetical protein [Gudongella sp.]